MSILTIIFVLLLLIVSSVSVGLGTYYYKYNQKFDFTTFTFKCTDPLMELDIDGNCIATPTVATPDATVDYIPGTVPANPTWTPVVSNIVGSELDIGEETFNKLFSKTLILKRECSDCSDDQSVIYYIRTTDIPANLSIYNLMTNVWASENNMLDTDFKLYSTLDDLSNNVNSWEFCNYDGSVGAFRDCGPKSNSAYQWFKKGNTTSKKNTFYILNDPRE
jgi:hypothetical protein